MPEESEKDIRFGDLLNLSTMTLATSSPDGRSFAAPIFFVAESYTEEENGLLKRLYFFSEGKSQHSQNLINNPVAAVTIYPQCSGWQDIRGFQMRGRVFRVTSKYEWDYAWKRYQEKFPFVSELKQLIALHSLYVFTPTWVRLIDNRHGFGYKQEWNLETIS